MQDDRVSRPISGENDTVLGELLHIDENSFHINFQQNSDFLLHFYFKVDVLEFRCFFLASKLLNIETTSIFFKFYSIRCI